MPTLALLTISPAATAARAVPFTQGYKRALYVCTTAPAAQYTSIHAVQSALCAHHLTHKGSAACTLQVAFTKPPMLQHDKTGHTHPVHIILHHTLSYSNTPSYTIHHKTTKRHIFQHIHFRRIEAACCPRCTKLQPSIGKFKNNIVLYCKQCCSAAEPPTLAASTEFKACLAALQACALHVSDEAAA